MTRKASTSQLDRDIAIARAEIEMGEASDAMQRAHVAWMSDTGTRSAYENASHRQSMAAMRLDELRRTWASGVSERAAQARTERKAAQRGRVRPYGKRDV